MTKRTIHQAGRRGFSLVEILIIITIIILLVGIMMPSVSRAIDSARSKQTRAIIGQLELGIAQYKNDHGILPEAKDASSNPLTRDWVECLTGYMAKNGGVDDKDGLDGPGFKLRAGAGARTYGPYVNINELKLSSDKKAFRDAFKDASSIIEYEKNSSYTLGYRIRSAGRDGQMDTADDITNLTDQE